MRKSNKLVIGNIYRRNQFAKLFSQTRYAKILHIRMLTQIIIVNAYMGRGNF